MFDERCLAFLAGVRYARLATIDRDGFPHNVPIWFDLEPAADGTHDVLFVSDRSATKTRNVLANPRAGVTIGGERADSEGYLIRGTITVEDDPGQVVTHRMIDRYESGTARALELREAWKDDDIVVLRLRPASVVSVWG
jgi:PPOX class probable F420-dependent enzyme